MASSLEISFMLLKAGLLSPRLSSYTNRSVKLLIVRWTVWEPRLLLPQPLEAYLGRTLPQTLQWALLGAWQFCSSFVSHSLPFHWPHSHPIILLTPQFHSSHPLPSSHPFLPVLVHMENSLLFNEAVWDQTHFRLEYKSLGGNFLVLIILSTPSFPLEDDPVLLEL